jgi:hypothetical protein
MASFFLKVQDLYNNHEESTANSLNEGQSLVARREGRNPWNGIDIEQWQNPMGSR